MNPTDMKMNIQKYASYEHTIFHGDAFSVLPILENESVDLIFVDPPYNIGKQFANFVDKWSSDEEYIKWCYKWLDLCVQKLSPSGSMYIMGSTQSMPYLDIYIRERLTILSRIIWHYDSSGVQAKNFFGSLYEPILHCVKDANNYTFNADDILVEAKTGSKRKLIDYRKNPPVRYNSKKVPGNVWYIPRVRYRMSEYEEHPSQKPEALLQRIITASSNSGDLVLDPFAGTFTTSAVARRLRRRSIGIETQEEYIMIGLRRTGITRTYKGEKLKPPQKNYGKIETTKAVQQLELGV